MAYVKKKRNWKEDDMEKAIRSVKLGSSIRKAARDYGMSEAVIRQRMNLQKKGLPLRVQGRTTVLSSDTENSLAKCISTLCRVGFSPTSEEIKDLVADYVRENKIQVSAFNDGRPGKHWLAGFMERNRLSLKKANMISSARKSATSNPFIIFDFFDQLEKVVSENNLEASQIWNCDESGFPTDPLKCKVISVKGETAYKVTCGARRENITVLAVVNAEGRALDPLVVFNGKNMQSTWRGEKALPGSILFITKNITNFDISVNNFCV